MKIADFKEKKITVMGLGLNGGGIGTVRFLSEAGAYVLATDMKSREEMAPSLEKLKGLKNVEYVFSQHRPEDFTKVDMVVKNPAASWDNKYIKMALKEGVPVEVDSSLFFKLVKNPIIGVTGTKGKTTTASLICHILKSSGRDVLPVGISRISVLDKIKEIKKDTWVVFELSSWRLSALGRMGISPHISVATNIYPDHLNYYKNMRDYIRDKKYICLNQNPADFCIFNAEDESLREFEKETRAKTVGFSLKKKPPGRSVYLENGKIFFNNGNDEKELMEVSKIKLNGRHNLENVLAAAAATLATGVSPERIASAVSTFSGVEHRLELVRQLSGIKYFNDTAATMPEAAVAGIRSFSEPVVLICGGADKNLDMDILAGEISKKVKKVILLKGEATNKLVSSICKKFPEAGEKVLGTFESMEVAVKAATGKAESGDVVLLSPGAASFGLFKNEFDRGEKFRQAVSGLK